MKVDGEYLFDAPPTQVWDVLFDPDVLASILPGATRVVREGDRYTGEMTLNIGPVEGTFGTTATIESADRPHRCTLSIDSASSSGKVDATAHVTLDPEQMVRTRMRYELQADVSGSVAAVGERLIEAALKAIAKQLLDELNWKLRAGVGAEDAVEVPPAARTPDSYSSKVTPAAPSWSPTEPIEPAPAAPPVLDSWDAPVPAAAAPVDAGAPPPPAPPPFVPDPVRASAPTPPPPPVAPPPAPPKAAPPPPPVVSAPPPPDEVEEAPRRGGGGMVVALLLLVAVAAAAGGGVWFFYLR